MALLASFHRERDVVSECFVFGTPPPGSFGAFSAAKGCGPWHLQAQLPEGQELHHGHWRSTGSGGCWRHTRPDRACV